MAIFKQEQQIAQAEWDNHSKYLFSLMTEAFCLIKPKIKIHDYQAFDQSFSTLRADFVKAWIDHKKGKSSYNESIYKLFAQSMKVRWEQWQEDVKPLFRNAKDANDFPAFDRLVELANQIYDARHPS